MVCAFVFEQLLHQKCKAPKQVLRSLEEMSFTCHGGHKRVGCDPLQASYTSVQEHIHPEPCLLSFHGSVTHL